jgi:hypothetical protein
MKWRRMLRMEVACMTEARYTTFESPNLKKRLGIGVRMTVN